jgi:heme-degrading monooxygenase HmoA
VTRLHITSRWRLPQFMFHSLRSIGQARRSRGYLGGWTSNDQEGGYWTATVWEDADAMRAFRNSGAHLQAMPALLRLSDQASFTHFEQAAADPPTPDDAYEHLRSNGRLSKVAAPSAAHLAEERVGRTPPRRGQYWGPRT